MSEMCMWLGQGGVGGKGCVDKRIGDLGCTSSVGTGGVLDVCLCLNCGDV